MQFIGGIERLNKEEAINTLSTLNVCTFGNLMSSDLKRRGKGMKDGMITATSKIVGTVHSGAAVKIDSAREMVDWEAKSLVEMIEEDAKKLSKLDGNKIKNDILKNLAERVKVDPVDVSDNSEVLAEAIIRELANHYKISIECKSLIELEDEIFEIYLKELLEKISKTLKGLDDEQEGGVAERVKKSLAALSEGEREAIAEELGLENLTANTLINVLKKGGGIAATTGALSSLGFGLFLATTTIMHAVFTTTLGITLPFAVYTGATSTLSFFLGPGAFLLMGLVGWTTLRIPKNKLNREILLLTFVSLKAQMGKE